MNRTGLDRAVARVAEPKGSPPAQTAKLRKRAAAREAVRAAEAAEAVCAAEVAECTAELFKRCDAIMDTWDAYPQISWLEALRASRVTADEFSSAMQQIAAAGVPRKEHYQKP